MTKRPSWDELFLELAEKYAEMGTCERLKVGSIIVKDNIQISAGFNGSIHGHEHCTDEGVGCLLNDEGRCIRTLHAEENAILHAERHLLEGTTIYVTHEPCEKCSKMIAQVGIKRIVFRNPYKNKWNEHFLKGVEIVHLPKEAV
jgi:dCMP deaminase